MKKQYLLIFLAHTQVSWLVGQVQGALIIRDVGSIADLVLVFLVHLVHLVLVPMVLLYS